MFLVSRRIDSCVSSSLNDSGLLSRGLPGSPGGESLSFASPKESNQRKGDPQSGSLRFASGNLRCSKSAEFLETSLLRSRQTSKNLFPLPPALLSPARTGFEEKDKFKYRSAWLLPESMTPPVLAGLEKVGGDGLKNLDVRRQRSWLVSRFSGSFSFFKEPRSGPDCGSPFFSLGFFGEAKKSKSPAGASPGMLAGESTLKQAQWQQEANK